MKTKATLTLKIGKKETSIKLSEHELQEAVEFIRDQHEIHGYDCSLMQKILSLLDGTPYEKESIDHIVHFSVIISAKDDEKARDEAEKKLKKIEGLRELDVSDVYPV